MQNNTVQTLIDYVKDLTGLDNVSDAKVIRALNFGVDNYSYLRITSSGTWQWDSRNQGDLPRVTASVVGGKAELEDELIALEHVEVLGVDGKYFTVHPKDQRTEGEPLDTIYSGGTTPQYYDLDGRTLRLFPAGSATVRLTFQRAHPRYSVDALTSATGVSPIDEEYIAMYAADRLMIGSKDPTRAAVRNELDVFEARIKDMASKMDRDTPRRLKATIPSTFTRRSRGNR